MLCILSPSDRQWCQHQAGHPGGSAGLTGKGVIYEAEGSGRTFNARTHERSPVGRSFKYRKYWSPVINCQGRKCPWTGDSPWLTLPFTEQEPTRGDGRTLEWRPFLVKEVAGEKVSGRKVQTRIVLLKISTEPENRCWVWWPRGNWWPLMRVKEPHPWKTHSRRSRRAVWQDVEALSWENLYQNVERMDLWIILIPLPLMASTSPGNWGEE